MNNQSVANVGQGFSPEKNMPLLRMKRCWTVCSALPELDHWALDIDCWIFNSGLSRFGLTYDYP